MLLIVVLYEKLVGISTRFIYNEREKQYIHYSILHLPELIAMVISVFMRRMNIPNDEIADFTDQILERRIPMLFDSFEAYDVQEIRRTSRNEGRNEGMISTLITLIQNKILTEKNLERISNDLKGDPDQIRELYHIVTGNPEKTSEELLTLWNSLQKKL